MNSKPKRLLIVDDEEDLTWSISKSLAKANGRFEIICVNSGDEALKLLSQSPVDLVISDVRMPGTNGLHLLLEIRKKYPQTKVIIMTACGLPEIEELANKCGSLHYIQKPFEISYLKKIIFEVIAEPVI